ncbi:MULTISPECIES: nucleotide exchange factor GrpE [unclassified Janibacter]|uniref:nucleotide exchange factor GrpE n=1 Tax=unclassified Janibacter TaxID=2649294 RepID=UPI003D04E98D
MTASPQDGATDDVTGASAPETVDQSATEAGDETAGVTEGAGSEQESAAPGAQAQAEAHPDTALAAERLADLQRLQAEYVNYKRRVDRDRAGVQERAVTDVLETLLPVLDEIQLAREHGDLTEGPMVAIADKLEQTLGKFGLERFGAVGEAFDPMRHEALMHAAWDADNPDLPKDADATTVVTLLQPGYQAGDRVLRPARVAVADPN